MEAVRVLFVCLGNICRSPTAEGVFRELVARARLDGEIEIDSAGTGAWHAGEPPDRRMRTAAKKFGFVLGGAARQVRTEDHTRFDVIFAMDRSNLENLSAKRPKGATARLELFRDYDPEGRGEDTPDPYYGGPEGFDEVVRIVERTSKELIRAYQDKRLP